MAHSTNLFRQVQQFCPRHVFDGLAGQHFDGSESRKLSLYDQFTFMLCAHASGANSLREAVAFFDAHRNRHYHLGVSNPICRSTISEANQNRSADFLRDLYSFLLSRTQRNHKKKFPCPIKIMDSTTISTQNFLAHNLKLHVIFDLPNELTLSAEFTNDSVADLSWAKSKEYNPGDMLIFDRAYFDTQWWEKLNKNRVFFISRLKTGVHCYYSGETIINKGNVKSSARLQFTGEASSSYSGTLRVITIHDERRNADFQIVTNNHDLPEESIAELYRKRWRIEFFFKWIKQHLKIRQLFSKSENGIKIQIWTGLLYYLMVWLLRETLYKSRVKEPFLYFVRLIRMHMFTPNVGLLKPHIPPPDTHQPELFQLFLHPTGQ